MSYTLANILADERAILDMVESEADADTALTLLDENAAALKQKAVGYVKRAEWFDTKLAMIEAETARLKDAKRALENERDRFLDRLDYTMTQFGLDEIDAGAHTIKYWDGLWELDCELDTVESLPEEFIRRKPAPAPEIKKLELKAALKSGRQIDGVRLQQGPRRLVIK